MATLSYITFAYISLINLTCSSLNNNNNNDKSNNNDDDDDDDDNNYREEKKANNGVSWLQSQLINQLQYHQ